MKRPTPAQWHELCDELVTTAKRLLADGPDLMRRGREAVRDGYPTSSLSGGARPGHGDPVGDLAVALADEDTATDAVGQAVADMLRFTQAAVFALRNADGARALALPPTPAPPEDALCVVHARYGLEASARASERCRWCNDYRKANGFKDPPETTIRALEDRRIERQLRSAA